MFGMRTRRAGRCGGREQARGSIAQALQGRADPCRRGRSARHTAPSQDARRRLSYGHSLVQRRAGRIPSAGARLAGRPGICPGEGPGTRGGTHRGVCLVEYPVCASGIPAATSWSMKGRRWPIKRLRPWRAGTGAKEGGPSREPDWRPASRESGVVTLAGGVRWCGSPHALGEGPGGYVPTERRGQDRDPPSPRRHPSH